MGEYGAARWRELWSMEDLLGGGKAQEQGTVSCRPFGGRQSARKKAGEEGFVGSYIGI